MTDHRLDWFFRLDADTQDAVLKNLGGPLPPGVAEKIPAGLVFTSIPSGGGTGALELQPCAFELLDAERRRRAD